jgi:hypothetical protein
MNMDQRMNNQTKMNRIKRSHITLLAGLGCAAIGLAHLQSGALRAAAPAVAAAATPMATTAPLLAGVAFQQVMPRILYIVRNMDESTASTVHVPFAGEVLFDR